MTPRIGERYVFGGSVAVSVTRVARDGSWADIRCVDADGATWSKRQRVPFPAGLVKAAS